MPAEGSLSARAVAELQQHALGPTETGTTTQKLTYSAIDGFIKTMSAAFSGNFKGHITL